MFAQSFMVHALMAGTLVAVIAGVVGYFVVLRGAAFVAHALPKMGFAGAAGAVWLHQSPLAGLAVFCFGGALVIGRLEERGRHDVVIALALVAALGTGALFLVLNNIYATGAYALLFGQIVGVSSAELSAMMGLGVICLAAMAVLFRPLLFASVAPDVCRARGMAVGWIDTGFLAVVGLAAAITVPVVGVLLTFSLLVAPAAAASRVTAIPGQAMAIAAGIAVLAVWIGILLATVSGWPVGFFVSVLAAIPYLVVTWRQGQRRTQSASRPAA